MLHMIACYKYKVPEYRNAQTGWVYEGMITDDGSIVC